MVSTSNSIHLFPWRRDQIHDDIKSSESSNLSPDLLLFDNLELVMYIIDKYHRNFFWGYVWFSKISMKNAKEIKRREKVKGNKKWRKIKNRFKDD